MKRRGTIVAAVLMMILAAAALWRLRDRALHDPAFAFLPAESGAEWIRPNEPTLLRVHNLGESRTSFRTAFTADPPPPDAVLTLRAMKRARVYLNGELLLDPQRPLDDWKRPLSVDLAPHLRAGSNDLMIEVSNTNGPRLLLALCESLDIATDATWDYREGDADWRPAISADTLPPSELSRRFDSVPRALLRILPWLALMFAASAGWTWSRTSFPITPARFRWAVMGAWLVLAANNISKIDFRTGFDIEGHINYIHYIYTNLRLPLPNEGWQTFQSPLYYLVSLPFYAAFLQLWDLDGVIKALRVIPLACAIAQIELVYRAARTLYPDRNDLQIGATILGGFLPINLYISQTIGNEPLAGCLSALAIFLALYMLANPASARPVTIAALGSCIGLAILTKITALLLVIPALAVVLAAARSSGAKRIASWLACFASPVLLIAGWYFLRNYLTLGQPLYGGWDPAREIVWWQDPGYRTPAQFFRFGEALVHPITAGTQGVWDALYSTLWLDGLLSSMVEYDQRPPWNYSWMIAGAWLGLVPTLLMATGVLSVLACRDPVRRRMLLFAIGCVAMYWAAFVYLFLTLPVYSTGKATYTLGVLPCYALLGAAGLEWLGRTPAVRACLYALLGVWALAAYLAYFVL